LSSLISQNILLHVGHFVVAHHIQNLGDLYPPIDLEYLQLLILPI
jgi:hypothetical protein